MMESQGIGIHLICDFHLIEVFKILKGQTRIDPALFWEVRSNIQGGIRLANAEIGHWQLRNPHQIMDKERHFVSNRTFALLENATYRR